MNVQDKDANAPASKQDDILQLAEAAGIAAAWSDAHGLPRHVPPTALVAILDALGLPCGNQAQCRDSRARLAAQQNAAALPPLLTAQAGQPIRLPQHAGLHGRRYRLDFETGGSYKGRFAVDSGLPLALPAIDLCGYHRLSVGKQAVLLAVAPARCFGIADAVTGNTDPGVAADTPAHLWGLALQLYSLRRQGDGGLGDFTTLAKLACDAAQQGAAAIAISPIHAMFSADPSRYSPYSPSSRLFLNALHIDPAVALGHAALTNADAGIAELQRRLEREPLIDWPAAAGSRLSLLRQAYTRFLQDGASVEFDTFCRQGGAALQDHARYEALQEWLPWQANCGSPEAVGDWRRWPLEYRDPRSPAVSAFAQQHREQIGFHLFLQWHAAQGLIGAQRAARAAGMPIGLITDLAIGADRGGSQAWSRQGELINALSVGAPPDLLNVVGQDWALGAYSPWALQASGFRAYLEMLRACFAHAGGVRIDHVLGLARLWLVPEGASAAEGAYLHYPMTDLLRLIALESWRYRAIVIGENLGTVPAGFDQRLAQANLLGICVLWFQRDQLQFIAPKAWSGAAMATTTTHDLPTVAGWWSENDIDWRAKLGLLEAGRSDADERALRGRERGALWQALTESAGADGPMPQPCAKTAPIDATLALVGSTPAPLVLIPMEDMLGLPEQPNLPGTIGSHPNWRRRLPLNVEQLLHEPPVATRLERLKQARAAAAAESPLVLPPAIAHKDRI